MNFLFLDMDGVLCLDYPLGKGPHQSLLCDYDAVDVLRDIIDETNCEIVISSDWRFHYNLQQMCDIFKFYNLKLPIGYTPTIMSNGGGWTIVENLQKDRGAEIKQWMHQHGFDPDLFSFWAAVDDMDLSPHLSRFVRTKFHTGIKTADVKEKLIKLLEGK